MRRDGLRLWRQTSRFGGGRRRLIGGERRNTQRENYEYGETESAHAGHQQDTHLWLFFEPSFSSSLKVSGYGWVR